MPDNPQNRYRHYKGGHYRILHHGKIEATAKPCVIYQAEKDGTVWVRTEDDFYSAVEVDGHWKPRFEVIR